jgi:hypothetical protein
LFYIVSPTGFQVSLRPLELTDRFIPPVGKPEYLSTLDTVAGSKNATGGKFLRCSINGTIGRGRGRVVVPVEFVVSALDTTVVGREMLHDCTY